MQGSGADHTERRTRPAWIRRAAAAAQVWPFLLVAGLWISGLPVAAPAQALASAPPSSLYAWGGNSSGQLGAASGGSCSFSPCSTIPLAAGGSTTFTQVAGGEQYTLALDGSGRVWAWGDNGFGQLGNGSTMSTTTPQQLPTFSTAPITQVAAGNGFSLALDASGTVWAWGNDSYGQLGNNVYGTGHEATTPVMVSGFNGVPIQAIAAGSDYALALDVDGNVWAWGGDASGQLGALALFQCGGSSLSPVGCTPTPSKVLSFPNPVHIVAIAAGGDHSLALDTSGQVWAWGNDSSGQLGIPPPTASPCGLLGLLGACSSFPVPVAGLPAADRVTALAAGASSSLALTAGGTVWAWGSNASGQLGFGFPPTNCVSLSGTPLDCSSPTPVQVAAPSGVSFKAIASGDSHSLALSTDEQVYAWGSNANGQLGNGVVCTGLSTTGCSAIAPAPVNNLAGMTGIGAGGQASFALGPAGYAPSISITPNSLDFGHQATGTKSVVQIITIANTSGVDVHIGSISVPPGGFLGFGASDFPTDASGCSNQPLDPGVSCAITVSFSPQATGPRSGTITINSDAGPGTAQTVQLAGYGDSPPTPTATATKVAGVTHPSSTPTKAPVATATATRTVSPTPTRTLTPTVGSTTGTTTTVVITPLPQPTSIPLTRPKPKPRPSTKPTVRAPCGGKALTVTVAKSVAAGGSLAVRLCAPERAKVVFTMQVTTKKVVVTGKGKKQKRTTHVSVRRIPLGVTVRKTVVVKKGKHRSTKVQTSVRYMTSVSVQADAHGRLATSFRVKDTPKKPEHAVLSATTHWSGKPVVRTAHVTVQPLHQHKGKSGKSTSKHH